MWTPGWRDSIWSELDKPWEMIVIGGGITGAGIFRQASRAGLRTLLVDGNDFAFGTSSRSSKLIHGGFRYLANRQFNVTFESVQERERLLREAPHLVEPLRFVIPVSRARSRLKYQLGVLIYDLMAPKWQHGTYSRRELNDLCRLLEGSSQSGIYYQDAKLDDSRLVIRTIREGVRFGGSALNYTAVDKLLTSRQGHVKGVALRDRDPKVEGRTREVEAQVVINATGPWSDALRAGLGLAPRLRRTRGSHLLFPRQKLPTDFSFTLEHPQDGRTLFTVPWENTTLIGTTDIDHPDQDDRIDAEPRISLQEFDYLMAAVEHAFPAAAVTPQDVIGTFSGLRPMVSTGEADPSKVSRAHLILEENGLISIMGGKLTTYRLMAHQALERACAHLPHPPPLKPNLPVLNTAPALECLLPLPPGVGHRMLGHYGEEIVSLLDASQPEEMEAIPGTNMMWSELRWAAREEGVLHLDDLLLRRIRIGLLLPNGGTSLLDRVRPIVEEALEWDEARWMQERERYLRRWRQHYSPYVASGP
jgi:glycerol-3-phosphate dehydrogenase